MHSHDSNIHAVVNGELYDYPRLRKEMEEAINYEFQGTSDCELVLALYQAYGLDFLKHCRGEFSICLYDVEKDLFLAVRDRYGIKPLFWTIQNDELWISTEMKAFLPLGWQAEWDVPAIVEGHFQIGPQTIFKGVQKVQPGHYLMLRPHQPPKEVQYWDSLYPDKQTIEGRSEQEMITGFHDAFVESIRLRLRADVKVGVSLSGGIDSSVVAGITSHLLKEGNSLGSQPAADYLSCFGIAFDEDSGFDESVTASRTADFLGVKFYKKHMNEQLLSEMFEDATWHNEIVNPDLNFVGVYALSELFREHGFTVNINGQGSDEILGGYNIFMPDFLREPDHAYQPPGIEVSDEERLHQLHASEAILSEVLGGKLDIGPAKPSVSRQEFNDILTPQQMSFAFPTLPLHPSAQPERPVSFEATYLSHLSPSSREAVKSKWHPLHSAQYVFTHGHLQNLILSNLGDRGEMSHSIEGRTPFLDHHLTEYTNNLPPSMKIRYDPARNEYVEKYILREAGKPYITDEVYRKKKHPYSAPVQYPVDGPLHKLMKDLVSKEKVDALGWLVGDRVEEVVRKAFEEKDKTSFRLVICLAQWVMIAKRFNVKPAIRSTKRQVMNGLDRKGENVMLG